MDAKAFTMMKPHSCIVNTARGPLIDETALLESLQAGHLRAAGLDVYAKEPVTADNPLLRLPNVVCTPHVGGLTLETFQTMIHDAMEGIRLFDVGDLNFA